MADEFTHTDLSLVGKHVPEYSVERAADGSPVSVELPGKYYIGTVVEGVFVPLLERKAAGLLADIERAKTSKAQQAEQAQTQQAEQPPATSSA